MGKMLEHDGLLQSPGKIAGPQRGAQRRNNTPADIGDAHNLPGVEMHVVKGGADAQFQMKEIMISNVSIFVDLTITSQHTSCQNTQDISSMAKRSTTRMLIADET